MSKGLGQSETRLCRSFDIATLRHFAALIVHSRASCLCANVNANSFSSGCHSPLTCGAYPFSAPFLVPHGATGDGSKARHGFLSTDQNFSGSRGEDMIQRHLRWLIAGMWAFNLTLDFSHKRQDRVFLDPMTGEVTSIKHDAEVQ